MVLAVILLAISALLASGALFTHQRISTYLAAAGVLWQAQWLLLTLLDRTVARAVASEPVFIIGAAGLAMVALLLVRRWQRPASLGEARSRRLVAVVRRELAAFVTLGIVLLAAWSIVSVNGFSGADWVVHGFYNGDVMTFISLVQRSMLTDGLVHSNPLAGGGTLEYPTLLHAGWATLWQGFDIGMDWLHWLPLMTLAQVLITVPLFFLLWDLAVPEGRPWQLWLGIRSHSVAAALQAGLVLYIAGLAWDGYIYPQSHFFLTGLFLLLIALLVRGEHERPTVEFIWIVPATLVALLLLLANAVTGTVAVAAVVVFFLLRAFDRGRPVWQRAGGAGAVLVWLLLFWLLAPGNGAFGQPGFSYTAALPMLRLAPVLLALIAAVWLSLAKPSFLSAAAMACVAMAFFTFVFSTRGIVVENADRFIYHALLIGFPLLLRPLVRLFYWLRRELVLTTLDWPARLSGWAGLAAASLLLLFPAGASVASAHDHLMRQDRQVVSAETQEGLRWLRNYTPADAVILASPAAPWAVPQFTGRALLRVDHWLSPQDQLFHNMTAAWQGDAWAQHLVLREAQFLLLTSDDKADWDVGQYEQVFHNRHVSIYRR
jgi:hypothetical protein